MICRWWMAPLCLADQALGCRWFWVCRAHDRVGCWGYR